MASGAVLFGMYAAAPASSATRTALSSSFADTTTTRTSGNFQRKRFSESRPAWPGRPRSSSARSGGSKSARRWNAASRSPTATMSAPLTALRTAAERISRSSGSSSTINTSMAASAPTHRLEQAYAGGHRNIETLYLSLHRNPHQKVAALAREPPHALALRAEHPGDRAGQVGFMEAFFGPLVGTDHPDFLFLQRCKRPREIG